MTLLSRAIWNPANSLKLMSTRRRGPSPVIPCSNCLKSRRWARERELQWFFTFIPVSWGAFLPTDTISRSDSIFAFKTNMRRERLHFMTLIVRLCKGILLKAHRHQSVFVIHFLSCVWDFYINNFTLPACFLWKGSQTIGDKQTVVIMSA